MNASGYFNPKKTNVFLTQNIRENTKNGDPYPLIVEQSGAARLKLAVLP
jgi:hypothetical protein